MLKIRSNLIGNESPSSFLQLLVNTPWQDNYYAYSNCKSKSSTTITFFLYCPTVKFVR